MSQLNQVRERVSAIQTGISVPGVGPVQAAYAYLPANLPAANCPFFVNEIARGGASDLTATGGLQRVDTTLRMHLAVTFAEGDASQELADQQVSYWRDAVYAAFAAKLRLGGDLPFVLQALITSWDLERLTLGSSEFLGLYFDLTVREMYSVTVAP